VGSLVAGITGVIRRERPDLVHAHLEAGYIAPFCARLAGVEAVVVSFHSSVLLAKRGDRSLRNAARRATMRRVARSADALVAGSDYAARAAARLCGVVPSEVRVIYNAVDVSRVDEAAGVSIRSELGLPGKERLLVTLGTVKEPKNHRLLVEALRRVSETRRDVSALIVGTGEQGFVGNLKQLAAEHGLGDKVFFLGYREDAYGIVKSSDLMVLPSLWEGLPVAALEGMACGTPVLLSDIPPHRDLIRHGVDGWLFSSNEASSLADAILGVLGEEESMRKVALAGSRKVRERFSSSKMADAYGILYEECIRSKSARAERLP
jgi:glycosyltransferase involved in cell wall biosynthesis